jgi:hypothetical protein
MTTGGAYFQPSVLSAVENRRGFSRIDVTQETTFAQVGF